MKPMICECCGGQIDPNTMMCRYCGTAYERDKYDRIVKIETFQNPVKIYKSRMDMDDYIVSGMGIDNATQMAVKQLSRNLADAIAENMEMEYCYDPKDMKHKINARIRIVESKYMF